LSRLRLPSFLSEVESAIADVEERTAAEVVVVVTAWSGSYRDVELRAGIALALLWLVVILFSPLTVAPVWVIPELALAFLCGFLLARRSGRIRRLLCSSRRRRDQVRAEAARAFHEEQVSLTRERTGLLVFVSLGEELGALEPDAGLSAVLPEERLRELEERLSSLLARESWPRALAEELRALGDFLAETLPVREDDVNELPNRIRVR